MMHLALGDSAGHPLNGACHPDEVLIVPDCLSCGPVGPIELTTLQQFFEARSRYWCGLVGLLDPWPTASLSQALRRACDSHAVTLWIGAGAAEQLFAAFFCALARSAPRCPQVRFVPFHRLATGDGSMARVRATSALTPAQLMVAPTAIQVQPAQLATLASVWDAWVSPSPERFVALTAKRSLGPVVSWDSLRSLLGRYPAQDSGLSAWDHALLWCIHTQGPNLQRVVGHALREDTDDLVGDRWLSSRVERMSSGSRNPLVVFEAVPKETRTASVALTPAGKQVLDGTANALSINGVDDWIGGVHLSEPDVVWLQTSDGLIQR